MPVSERISISIIDVPKKDIEGNKNGSNRDTEIAKPADFETAIAAAGYGKFQYLLFLAIIPASWASSFDTGNVSMILPSAECDLQMSLLHKGILNAITYVGMVASGFLWGYLADVRGRRKILIYGYLGDGICGFLSGFSQDFWTLVFFKFICGFMVSGPYATIMSYCSEFYSTKERATIPLKVGFSIASGSIVNAVLAWLVVPRDWSIVLWDGAFVYNSWRIFLSLCGLPTLFGVICLWFFPESPKFLMSQGRNEEALEVFQLIYKINTGKSADNFPIRALEDETMVKTANEPSPPKKDSKSSFREGMDQMKAIFYYPHLTRLLLVITLQFGGMLGMNTIRLWQPQLFATLKNFDSLGYDVSDHDPTFCEILDYSTVRAANETAMHAMEQSTSCTKTVVAESVYVDTIIMSCTVNLCLLLANVFLNLLSHKTLLLISYVVSLVCLISINWSTSSLLTLVLTCAYVGLMGTTLNIIIGAAIILFPTSLRTMAVSLEMMIGRAGSMIGNVMFPVLLAYGCLTPIITLSTFSSLCIVLTYFLPNTRQKS